MAIYLTHQYGTRFYGPEPEFPQFDAGRFRAFSVNYSTVHVEWAEPSGEYEGFRLVKNRSGYPVSEDDGEVLLDADVPDVSYDDTDVKAGFFTYYAAFLKVGGVWQLVAVASCLHIANHNSHTWLTERLPIHYQIMRGNRLDLEAEENTALMRFMAVFGWGLDRMRTSLAAARRTEDAPYTHIDLIDILIAQYGLPAWPGLSGARKRAFVRDAAALLAMRGTPAAMLAAARAASGWDLVLRPSPNLVLTADQSTMINPRPPVWDPTIVYHTGDRVWLEGAAYRCTATAQGYDQMPEGERLTNTYWAPLLVIDANTAAYDLASASQHNWQALNFTSANKAVTELVLGVPVPLDNTLGVNAVTAKNTHSATSDIGARLLPEAVGQAVKPITAITTGIPLHKPQPWAADAAYPAGSLVSHLGRLYQALRPGRTGSPPHTSDRWKVVGSDDRIKLTVSAYTHQPHTDAAKPTSAAHMFVEWYDERGNFISRDFGLADSRVLDTFTNFSVSQQVTLTSDRFTVSASTNYDLLLAARASVPTALSYSIRWYTSANALISTSVNTPTATIGAWKTNTFAVTSPSNAASAELVLTYTISDGSAAPDSPLYIDSAALGVKSTPITSPTAKNANATFDTNTNNWAVTGGTLVSSADRVFQGSASAKITPNVVSSANGPLAGRVTEYGGKAWTTRTGSFVRDSHADGVARPLTEGVRSLSTIDYGSANATVSSTLTSDAPAGMTQALIIRYTSLTTYIRATRSAVQTVNGAAVTTLATYGPLADGDRLTVRANGDTITVLRNGTQVATVTTSYNNTATNFGIAVEA